MNKVTRDCTTALHYFVRRAPSNMHELRKCAEVLDAFLAAGADINVANKVRNYTNCSSYLGSFLSAHFFSALFPARGDSTPQCSDVWQFDDGTSASGKKC